MKHENLPQNVLILMEVRRMVARGWVKGMAAAGDSVCLSHALWVASRQYDADPIAIASIVASIIGTEHIPSWNDCAWRTLDEVLGVLDEAIMREIGALGPPLAPARRLPIKDFFFDELEKIGG